MRSKAGAPLLHCLILVLDTGDNTTPLAVVCTAALLTAVWTSLWVLAPMYEAASAGFMNMNAWVCGQSAT